MYNTIPQVTSHKSQEDLEFNHFVVANSEGVIFASARRDGKVENFLIDINGRWVKQQVNSRFEDISPEAAKDIKVKANLAYGRVPIYRVPTFNFS